MCGRQRNLPGGMRGPALPSISKVATVDCWISRSGYTLGPTILSRPGVCNYPSFLPQSPFDFDGAGRGRQAKWGAPDPGPRSSGDQGTYLACLPARNIRPSHSPSTWARPAPPRRPGFVLTHRTSHGRPIQPTRPLYMTHSRSKLSRRVCILRGSRTAGGPSRFETQGCAANGTADSPHLWRAATYNIMFE